MIAMSTILTLPRPELDSFQLHAVQPVLRVRDIAESVAWYRDVLGFEEDFVWGDPPEHARVHAIDHTTRVAIQLSLGLSERPDPNNSGWIMIHVGEGIDRLYEQYRERGVEIARELDSRPWGMRDFDILDIDGNRIRFAAEG